MNDFRRILITVAALVAFYYLAVWMLHDDCADAVQAQDFDKWIKCGCYHTKL